jgi:photosystem II stability/assembly factor-like uncharacterized protein
MKKPLRKMTTMALAPALALLMMSSASAASADVLDAPAQMSARAGSLVQLAVARAGDRLVSVGERGVILLSDDSGKTWRQTKVPVSVTLTRVSFVDAKTGWAIGHGGVVLGTQDAGETWLKQLDGNAAAKLELAQAKAGSAGPTAERRLVDAERLLADGADKPFLAMHFFDARRGLVVGAYGLAFATEDGGQSWQSLMGPLSMANGRHLYVIHAAPGGLYLAGEQGLLLASSDSGVSFSKVEFPGKGTLFGMVSTKSGQVLLAYGLKGNAYRSADAGKSWQKVDMPPVSLVAGLRQANGDWVLADESGQLHRSDDEGQHFKRVPLAHPVVIASLLEMADGTLVGSGVRGTARIELKQDKVKVQP